MAWYNPTSWNVGGVTAGDFFRELPNSGRTLANEGLAGLYGLGGNSTATASTPGQGGYGALSSGSGPSQWAVSAGAGALANQLMQGEQPFFAELDRQNALARWTDNLQGQSRTLKEQDLRGQYGAALAKQSLAGNDITARRNRLGQEPGFIGREYGLDIRSAENASGRAYDQYGTNIRNLYSDATVRGALQTEGAREGRTDIGKQLLRDLEDVGIAKGRAGLGRDRSLADVTQANALLDNESKKLGIDRGELERQLNQGLAQLGLQGQMDAQSLATALASTDIQKVQAASRIAQMIAGTDPAALAGMAPTAAASSPQGAFGMGGRFTR